MAHLGVLQQNKPPVSRPSHPPFSFSAGAVSSSPTQPDLVPSSLLDCSLLPFLFPLSLLGFPFLKFIYNHTLSAGALLFLLPRARSPVSVSSLSSGRPLSIAATGLCLLFVLFLFF